jgi:hypothetical protein
MWQRERQVRDECLSEGDSRNGRLRFCKVLQIELGTCACRRIASLTIFWGGFNMPGRSSVLAIAAAVMLTGCAASPELVSCLDPNRRVAVELTGFRVKPAPAPVEGKKPGKPGRDNVALRAQIQGSSAWDVGSAVLKKEGMAELDSMVQTVNSGAGKEKRPTNVEVVIVTGHNDRLEEKSKPGLSEQRAKAVTDYLVSKGISSKVIFWEGRGARDPVAVTKFCDA